MDLCPKQFDVNSVGEQRVLGRERAAAAVAVAVGGAVAGEVLLEQRDLVADVRHGGPQRRRVLRAHEPELDELDDGHLGRRRGRPRPSRRVREDGAHVVRVVPPHPVVQREPLVEDHVRWPLPGDELQEHYAKAVHVALRRRMPSQSVL